jgi:hypothetical protein
MGQEPLTVEVEVARPEVWRGERVELAVRVAFDPSWFATAALPLSARHLDPPFLVTAPWLQADDRAVELPPPAPSAHRLVATGDRVVPWTVAAPRAEGEAVLQVLELRCRWLPPGPGPARLAPVEVHYAFATRFRQDFLGGRQPLDATERTIASSPIEVRVRELPSEGRPDGFTGAVGEFFASASVAARQVAVGESVALEVRVTGAGNLAEFGAMPVPELPGFRVLGGLDRLRAGARVFVFDLVALRPTTEVPAVAFAAFSPRLGRYVVHRAEPVPLRVVPAADAQAVPDAAPRGPAQEPVAAQRDGIWWVVALVLGAGLVVQWRRRVGRRRREREVRQALQVLESTAPREPAERQRAFEALCARAAGSDRFVGDGTFRALVAAGRSRELVERARALHAELDAARFGGEVPDGARLLDVAREVAVEAVRDRARARVPDRPV